MLVSGEVDGVVANSAEDLVAAHSADGGDEHLAVVAPRLTGQRPGH
jgi:hypothetical protein